MIDLGDPVLLQFPVTAANGNLAAGTTVTLVITQPDGTTTTAAISNPSIGWYEATFLPTQPGRHTVRWTNAGTNPTGLSDAFDVREAPPPFIVSLADVKEHLNITATTDDEELRGYIEAATRVVEDVVGPVVPRTVTEVHQPSSVLALRSIPVLSLVSVTQVFVGGISYDVNTLDVDLATGIVRPLSWAWPVSGWSSGWGNGFYRVPLRTVHLAGRRIIPATMTLAAKVIIAHMWDTQRGHGGGVRISNRPGIGGSTFQEQDPGEMSIAPSYMIPRRAIELLAADRRVPLMA